MLHIFTSLYTNGLVALLLAKESLWMRTDLLCPIYCQIAKRTLLLGHSEANEQNKR